MIITPPGRTRWLLPTSAFSASLAEMAIDGARGCEGVALWLGARDGDLVLVSHVVLLRGDGVVKRPALLGISPAMFNEVTDVALANKLTLVGQIHSHGPGWPVDLSLIDRSEGLHVGGYLSVVAPDYAMTRNTTIADCGVHEYVKNAGYRRLQQQEIQERIQLITEPAHTLVAEANG